MRRSTLFLLVLVGATVAGCDLAEEPFRPQLVVEGILVAHQFHPPIRLTSTFDITRPVPPDLGAVSGASLSVARLTPDGDVETTVRYVEDPNNPGLYLPLDPVRVVNLRRYRLDIDVPAELGLVPPGERVVGETFVPDTFRVVQAPPDSVRYNLLAPPMELRVTPSHYPGRSAIYLFSIIALDPIGYGLTPTYAALVTPGEEHRLVEGSSPLLNEESYQLNPDGTRTLSIPWFVIAYYGPNRFVAHALDDALYDFLRSRDAQFGGGTLSPGEIPGVLTNLTHAVGVFGSVSRAEVEVYIRE